MPWDVRHPQTPAPDVYRPMTTSSGGRLLSIPPPVSNPVQAALGVLCNPAEAHAQAVAKAMERLRLQKAIPLVNSTSLMGGYTLRSASPARWSERVSSGLMQSPSFSRSPSLPRSPSQAQLMTLDPPLPVGSLSQLRSMPCLTTQQSRNIATCREGPL